MRPGGRLAYYTIFIPPGLSKTAYRRATRIRSGSVTSWRREQQELLTSAGFAQVEETDVTDEFLRITLALLGAKERYATDLRLSQGQSEFDRVQRQNRATAAAIEAGLFRRSLFVAQQPR